MLRHKLGWQTSDQQDKAVSREVGVLLVLASVLPAGWRAGSEAAALQQGSCAARGLRGSGVGVPPAATGSPRTPSPNSTRASNHCRAPRLGPPSPKARMYTCPSFGDGPFEPGQGQRGLWRLGLGVRGACLGTPGEKRLQEGSPAGGSSAPGSGEPGGRSRPAYGRRVFSQVPRGGRGEVLGAWATPDLGSCHPQPGVTAAGLAWRSLKVMSPFKNLVTVNTTFPWCQRLTRLPAPLTRLPT